MKNSKFYSCLAFLLSIFISASVGAVPAILKDWRWPERLSANSETPQMYRGIPLVAVIWDRYAFYCPTSSSGYPYVMFEFHEPIVNAQQCFYGYCPAGTVPMFNSTNCEPANSSYYSATFPDQAKPQACAGNPIDVSSGSKIQTETHIPVTGYLGLLWHYRYLPSATGEWQHNYQKKIVSLSDQSATNGILKTPNFSSASEACLAGWPHLRISNNFVNPNITSGTPQFINNRCVVSAGGKILKEILVQSNESINLINLPSYIQVNDNDGSKTSYRGIASQSRYQDVNGSNNILIKDSDHWTLSYSNGQVEYYDLQGKLTKIILSSGATQILSYDSSTQLLTRVQDNVGHKLDFTYQNNQIQTVTLDNTKVTRYSYNAYGLIDTVTFPGNATRIYHYEDTRFPTALTGITDERNVRYATWAYDAQGRAISSEHAGGAEKTLLTFNADNSTTVTNSLGKQTIYRFEYINGAKRVVKVEGQASTNCLAANKDYTYTPEGWIESKTDWKGIKTTYSYNTLGQEISRTEAFGTSEAKTTTTEWHQTLYVKTKVTEPERETTYVYDDDGKLLSQKTRSLIAQ